jgi:hypothetical protein
MTRDTRLCAATQFQCHFRVLLVRVDEMMQMHCDMQ